MIDIKQSGIINGHEWVDMGLSVKWATCNVGASSPSDCGFRFAWGVCTQRACVSSSEFVDN